VFRARQEVIHPVRIRPAMKVILEDDNCFRRSITDSLEAASSGAASIIASPMVFDSALVRKSLSGG